ncbi:MAG: serine/threonine protein kinase [Myxococcales bacterium]|nr:serine/threonine protein kinase [Myxococcales bacterium]
MDPQQGPPQPDLLIGQTVGNYLVTQKLGEGGMGAVYLAEHPAIGKKVALKVLHAEFSNNQEVAERFFNEAKAVNNIGHPNIVDIVDYGVIQSGPSGRENFVYFIMEYLSGFALTHLIRTEAPLPPERALSIALQIADALGASHKCGIVHRDLKPDNVMLQQRGRERDFVKLLDFGIAKLTGDSKSSHRTRTGIVMGTPAYMSPEQCEGKPNVDQRTDIYALGILLYEMLTGRVPFIGEGYGEILVQHLTQHPLPPSQYRMLPPHVEVVVLKALEKRADMRYPTMDELMRAMADPVGYVEAHGGPAQFLQRQLMPSSAPVPLARFTPTPFTPIPGSLHTPSGIYTPSSGIHSGVSPAPTTLGAAVGEVQPKRSKAGFLIAGVLVLAAAGVGLAVVLTGNKDDSATVAKPTTGSDLGNDHGSSGSAIAMTVDHGSDGSATPQTGSGSARAGSGSAIPETGSGSATPLTGSGSGSATSDLGSAGSAGSAAIEPAVSTLTLTSVPTGAAIFVDGKDTGMKTPSPLTVDKAKGTVTVTLKLDKYDDLVKKLSVAADATQTLKLKKKGAVNPTGGRGSNGRGSGSARHDDTSLERPD